VRTAWLLVLAVGGGCYDPAFEVGLPCSPSGDCPSGQVCAADQTCQLTAGGGDAGPTDDGGGTPDAMPDLPIEPWFVSFQHPAIARASDVAAVGGGFALAGSSLVMVLDPRGEVRWQRELDIYAGAVAGVAGGMVVAGTSDSHVAAIGLDQDGAIRWQKHYTDQESSYPWAVVGIPGSSDAILVAQSTDAGDIDSAWLLRVDGSGDVVWQERFTLAVGVQPFGGGATQDGGVVLAGVRDGATLEERDLIAFKVDADGDLRWQKVVSGGDNEWGNSAAVDANGHVWVIGGTWSNSFGAADLWVLRLNESNGALQSQHRIGTAAQDTGLDVFPYAATGALLVGETADAGNTDLFVIETKEDAITTQFRVGSGMSDFAAGAAEGNGGVVVFGDSGAFGDNIGFFAAGLPMPEGLDGPCPHDGTISADMATSTATASNLDFTVTATTATPTDLTGTSTAASIGDTAECE
jgi:hypothetical protein